MEEYRKDFKKYPKDDRIFDNLLTLNARFKKNNRSINFKRFFFQTSTD